ncbi:MAG TPA: gliding motility lipoprotein GldB [Eudoraea sp.]|nr:gliding motility lipoprotein GldB [Eudoraea sp.]
MYGLRFALTSVLVLLVGCREQPEIPEEIAGITIDLKVLRFDREFAGAQPNDIPSLKEKYPYLFPEQYTDSVWEAKLKDTLQIELLREIGGKFGNFERETEDLELLFKHIKYYFPRLTVPTVVTLPTDVDYRNRVILADTLLLIGLDNYLGRDHRYYARFERYIAAGLDRKYIMDDVAGAVANKVLGYPGERSLLARMIYYGKHLFIKEKLLPLESDHIHLGYSEQEMEWAMANEEQIWRYLIERELLYSTDNKLDARFLDPAPFSKFGLELDNESPGKIGRYMGWQIVRAFMENNEISLVQLLTIPAEEIFKKSNYKPKK